MNEYWTRPRQKNDILVLKEHEIKEDFELGLFHLGALMSYVQAAFVALLDTGTRPKSPVLRLNPDWFLANSEKFSLGKLQAFCSFQLMAISVHGNAL